MIFFILTMSFKEFSAYPTNVPDCIELSSHLCAAIENQMNKKLIKYRLEITGIIIGAIAGLCYWYFVGCASGTCPITSRPLNSALYGAMMGFLAFSMFKNGKAEPKEK